MKHIYVVAGILLILGATFAIEWYTDSRFPTEDLVITGVPELEIGATKTFSYIHEMELVGTYSYTVTDVDDDRYTMISTSDVTNDDMRLLLTSSYVFDTLYTPKYYTLTVDQEGNINQINVTFTDTEILSVVSFLNETVYLTDTYSEGVLLTENNMPGFWELLILSSEMKAGQRYALEVYIPQGGSTFELEFYVNPKPQTVTVDGERLSCTSIHESTLDLRFYLYEGRMVQMRNDDQDLTFTLIS